MARSRSLFLFKPLFFIIFLLVSLQAESFNNRFDLNFHNDSLSLDINLEDGYKLYGRESAAIGMPTVIDFNGSQNLAEHSIWWPSPDIDIEDSITSYTYKGNVKIPIGLKAQDSSKEINLRVNLSYVLCKEQCFPIKQALQLKLFEPKNNPNNMCMIILTAFLGGLILNFMPCVLPVLALKAISATKITNSRRSFIITSFGIMTSFWALSAVSIVLKATNQQFGIGMGFQSTKFIIFLSIMITIFISLNLEKSNITLPAFVSNLGGARFSNKYLEDFMTGIIATLLSIPCTAPFLGSAVLVAIAGSAFESLVIFTAIGVGFSLPYLLFAIAPSSLQLLPKPGVWMDKFKKAMTLLFIATLFWLLWLIWGQLGLRATLGLFLILMLIKFVLEESKIKAKILCILLLTCASLYLPQLAHNQDEAFEKYRDTLWQEFDRTKLRNLLAEGKIVVVDVTADWCLTCKYNKLLVWDRAKMLTLLKQENVVAIRANGTVFRQDISDYLKEHGVYGIPFTVVYGPKAPQGLVMPTLVSYENIIKAIKNAK